MKGLFAAALILAAGAASAQQVVSARYTDATDRYHSHVFAKGKGEWGALEITLKDGEVRRFVLPHAQVFEDLKPHLADLDGDGSPEVIVVESNLDLGARLAIYDPNGFVTSTGWLGQHDAWLAPVGAIDLNHDGRPEVGFVVRPHTEKVLAIYRYADRHLEDVIEITPFTNHQIGQDYIAGGTRTCRGTPAFVLANGAYTEVVEVTMAGDTPHVRSLGPVKGPESFENALACKAP
jgi:hypothetical protein